MAGPLVGIFVGGRSRRMGGRPKGLLPAPDRAGETLVERLARIAAAALPASDIVLVGEAKPYAELGIPALADDPEGIGPLGGLSALLAEAERRGAPSAVALACDMPFVSAALLERLGAFRPDAAAVAPRQDGRWQPLCARYAAAPALAAARRVLAGEQRALFAVLDELGDGAAELPLEDAELELLRDWDRPEDLSK